MQPFRQILKIAGLCIAFLVGPGYAQQPDSLLPQHFSPITLDQPRAFPPPSAIQARPMPTNQASTNQPQPAVSPAAVTRQPPVNVRLLSAEEPLAPSASQPPLRLAPRSHNGRGSLERPAASDPTSALVSVGGSLAAVLGVFLVVVWCTRRFAPAGTAVLPKEAVESLGRTPLTARQQMQLIRVGNKLLLVALSATGVEPLTEISDAAEVEHLLALCRRGQKGSSTEIFRQTLAQLASEPAPRGFVGPSPTASRGAR